MEKDILWIINYIKNNNLKIILSRRDKNIIFCKRYLINIDIIRYIISLLNVDNFVSILDSDKMDNSKLYLFAPYINYLNDNILYNNQIYFKFQLFIEKKVIVIISLHEAKYKLDYNGGDFGD